MKNLLKASTVALFLNTVDAKTKWQVMNKEYPGGDKFEMRWYSYVPEEQADEGAIFAPTVELNFAEKIPDDAVVRICLGYRPNRYTLGDTGAEETSGDLTSVEVICAYTATDWLTQDWELKWAKEVKPQNLPKFVAGTNNAHMATYGDGIVDLECQTGWAIEATFMDQKTGKTVLLDLTRWQDILQIEDKSASINPLIMYPSFAEAKNEIDLIFSYAVYSSGSLAEYPTNEVKGDITTTETAASDATDVSLFDFSKQNFIILNAQEAVMFMYAFASSAAVISTFASLF